MDSDQFDRLTEWVGRGNRRQMLGSVLGAGTVLLAVGRGADVAAKRGVHGEGPCGNGSIKDNRCKRNSQCCTGVCDKQKGKQPYGRCRCRKLNQSCQEDRNCCATAGQPMSCVAGTCQTTTSCVPDDGACGAGAECCAGLECEAGICQGAVLCVPLGGACTGSGHTCCTNPGADSTCTSGICRDSTYCETVLEGAGCAFLAGPGVWNCGSQDLTGVNLSGCDLTNASFFNTNASNVTFVSTILTGANFFDAEVTGAEWDNTTCPSGTNSDANSDTCCGEFILGQTPTGCAAG